MAAAEKKTVAGNKNIILSSSGLNLKNIVGRRTLCAGSILHIRQHTEAY